MYTDAVIFFNIALRKSQKYTSALLAVFSILHVKAG